MTHQESVYIHTFSGMAFDLLNPRPEMIRLADIIQSLSIENRFNGATLFPYSVAQHSLYVASLLPRKLKLHGLLHDAAEAYVGDMVTPLKKIMPEYKKAETRIAKVVAEVFGLAYPEPGEVKQADLSVLSAEREQVLLPSYGPWYKDFPVPAKICIEAMSWVQVKERFSSQIKALLANHNRNR
ncbi:MAG: phosphohydrolase [Verrucomicrobiota bacterium]